MTDLKKYIILFLCILGSCAQSQNFTANVNAKVVEIGQYFQLSYTINSNASNFIPPEFKDFDVYSGPNQSSSMSFINGTMSSSLSLSYYLVAKRPGVFTIGPAKINANGKQLQSNSVTIEVVKGSNTGAMAQGSNPNTGTGNEHSSALGSGDVFIKTTVNKQHCFLGEQLVVKQKIYSLHQMKGFQNYKAPSYTGFWSKEEEKSAQLTQRTENIDGKTYFVVEFNSTILFPQRSGKLAIEPVQVDVIAAVQSRNPRSLMEQFFGGGYEERQFSAKSRKVEIDVEALPESSKPATFHGAVGNFSFKAELNKNKVKENEAINMKIVISGKGNINLLDEPSINFPEEFETYDPKITENINVKGIVSGTKTYDYLIIPRKKGNYELKDFGFSYFDTDKKQYVSIPSPQLSIFVEQGDETGKNEITVFQPDNEIETVENDIRYIKKGDLNLTPVTTHFFASGLHYSILGIIALAFIALIFGKISYEKRNSNTILVKERKAAKLARKQLVSAEKYMNSNEKEKFYHEISIALNQYISNKMNIPVSELSRQSIYSHMSEKNIDPSTQNKFVELLDNCEYARYAPGNLTDDLKSMHQNTVQLITEIEKQYKS